MAFIRTRKLKYDAENKIVSGTAAIIESHYISGNVKNHSKQNVREKLGKVVEMYSKKCGLFLSPTRGLVIYNSETDEFSDPVTRDAIPSIELMRTSYPEFGNACFVDSTPLPNDIDTPFSALCSHGIATTAMQMRLVLILDEASLLWQSKADQNI